MIKLSWYYLILKFLVVYNHLATYNAASDWPHKFNSQAVFIYVALLQPKTRLIIIIILNA